MPATMPPELPPSELLSLRRPPHRGGALVLVAEDEPALLEVVRRHLDGDAVARERLDAVLFHLAGRIGDDPLPGVELDAIARVRQDFGDKTFELDQLFFCHRGSLASRSAAILPRRTARVIAPSGHRTLQKADPADALDVMPGRTAMAVGLVRGALTRPLAVGRAAALAAALGTVALVASRVAALRGAAMGMRSGLGAARMAALGARMIAGGSAAMGTMAVRPSLAGACGGMLRAVRRRAVAFRRDRQGGELRSWRQIGRRPGH